MPAPAELELELACANDVLLPTVVSRVEEPLVMVLTRGTVVMAEEEEMEGIVVMGVRAEAEPDVVVVVVVMVAVVAALPPAAPEEKMATAGREDPDADACASGWLR